MPPGAATPREPAQIRALTGAFLARFFESEATAGATDMRRSFFWLVAALATPGVFLPMEMYLRWQNIAHAEGLDVLHRVSLRDKTVYLYITFIGIGLLCALVWQALLVDRRDGLVLGGLPLRPRTILASKLFALVTYVLLISVGMHTAAAVLFGMGLGSAESAAAVGRNFAAMLIAGSAANVFVFACVAGGQSLCLALAGPRRFVRVSPLLQVSLVAAVVLLLVIPVHLPGGDAASGAEAIGTPPLWFVGLYETIAGTPLAVMPALAARALLAIGLALGVLVLSYPIACRRALTAAVEGTGSARGVWLRRVAGRVAIWITRRPQERAAVQLLLATIGRVHQHRLILSFATGAALAGVVPMAVGYVPALDAVTSARPPLSVIGAPLFVIALLVLGLRGAIAVPSELPASWIFAAAPSPMFAGRDAARRVLFAFGVALPLVLVAPLWIWAWGPIRAAAHLAACALGGATLVETTLWGFVGMPVAKALAPARANIQGRWPLYLGGLYLFTVTFPAYQLALMRRPGLQQWIMCIPPALVWWAARRGSRSAALANGVSGDPHDVLAIEFPQVSPAPAPATKERHA